ncbi:MAG TPA: family 20 glycosylhydrolase [Rhodanobacteraceae bacterium]
MIAMRRAVAILAVLLAGCAQTPPKHAESAPAQHAPLALIPMPARITVRDANFVVSPKMPVFVMSHDPAALSAARYFADTLRHTSSFDLHVAAGDALPPGSAIVFAFDPEVGAPEGYVLDVESNRIEVRARTAAGLFYGGITLWQLLTPRRIQASPSVPELHIEDYPRFAWRGLMLDSARHYQPVAFIKKLLDEMALHKLNIFQWHLTDDQGWRIAIARYPELTKVGAWRRPVGPDVALAGRDGRYGGYYTQEEIREVVRYAAARHITVVPEIEMPGHATAAIASYPQFGVTGKRPQVSSDWGVHTWIYNIDDGTFRFLDNVIDEVMALFPGPYIHVGGDEAVKDQWQASKKIQRRMRALGIEDEAALQAWFVDRIGEHISSKGRRLVGWDEILQGGLPKGAIVMSWRGAQGAIDAAKLGHDTVMSPSPAMYFDRLQSDLPDEPTGRPDVVSLMDVYGFEPVPQELDAEQAKHVIGAQANLWSEYLTTPARVEHAVFPRIDALAEVLWSPRGSRDWQGFLQRMPAQLERYRALGVGYSDDAFAVKIEAQPNAGANTARITLSNQTAFGTIRYTLDGSEPDARSPKYREPLSTKLPITIRANAFVDPSPAPDHDSRAPSPESRALAGPRSRELDARSLLRLSSDQLKPCTNGLPLRLEDGAGEAGTYFTMDLLDPCWIYPRLDLSNIAGIDVRIGTVPDNFQLWHDIAKIVTRPAHSPAGELEIHQDTCDGPLLASMPMANVRRGEPTTVRANIAARGAHDLCFFYTGLSPDFLRAIDRVSPIPH